MVNEFRVEATNDHTSFKVLVRGLFGLWVSGYIHTDYFGISYKTEEEALAAIRGYKSRFTDVQ